MTRDSSTQRYGKLSIALHWLMLGLFVGVYASIEIKGLLPRGGTMRSLFLGLHGLLGASIFLLVWVRLLGRLTPRPPITPALPTWQTGASHLMHLALYGLMIATPLLAWLMLSAAGKPMPYFGFFLPSLVSVDPDLAKQFKHWHELLGSSGYWLIGLHAAAGLFHHYWVRDNTLARILPKRF
ncbi:cytochrome b [Pseudomonas sp. MF6784]|jgi:superoxide oxidase|uniref:cytochrome b n=1 Tax=Pseudomonas TaxID=286 RepID=UPI0018E784A4|nr:MULTISPECIES: cytochrome b [unclassified Pseudomonas]MDZ4300855.1 cytochrome b [Pseudomonas sp.]MBJ2253896.1 cytochrome b [Pseudomonas sp. MF6784]MBJ2291276.1 cytochrome b [Pseudomonas sp. MF5691]MBK3435812.1 cytochrome b [Pseudomonas sp. MF7448]MBK3455507.1 cytochrome b [Pseudomonas sp. MF6754]